MQIGDIEPFVAQRPALDARDCRRGVGRVVEHLDLEAVAWVIDARRRVDQALRDEHLVEHGQLDRDDGQVRFVEARSRRSSLVTVAQVQEEQRASMSSV